MTIKNDRWIRSQCMLPIATVSYMHQDKEVRTTHRIFGDPFTNVDEEIDKHLATVPDLIRNSVILGYPSDEAIEKFVPMIEPFLPMQVRTAGHDRHLKMLAMPRSTPEEMRARIAMDFDGDDEFENRKIISKGLTSFGYDVTLADDAAIFSNINGTIIDPLHFVEEALVRVTAKHGYFIMPPNSYMLGYTKEYFRMPRNVIGVALGKSTYARAGAIVNVTPIEPGFEGTVVIEIANATSLPMKVYTDQGIAQFLFFESDEECETSYAERNGGTGGKYQGQRGLVLAKG